MMLELKYHTQSCFLTCTYAVNPVHLNISDHQNFLKRLRKKLAPLKIRYFMCGEYGGKGNRPHYHYIIFGWCPDDLVFFKISPSGEPIYLSKTVSNIWQLGFITVGMVTARTCKYTAKYLQKLDEREHKVSPFTRCSTNPGIGYQAYVDDVQNIISTDKVYTSAGYYKTPRYFLKLMERDGIPLEELKLARVMRGALQDNSKKASEQRIIQAKLKAKKAGITKIFIKRQKKHKKPLTIDKINGIISSQLKRFDGLEQIGGDFDDV